MAESVEVNLLAFMTIDAAKEWHLNPVQASSIAASVFAGEIAGCSAFGLFGDRFGRKPAFILSIALIAGFGVASSFSPNVYVLVCMRFLVGVGIGGFSVPYDLLAEICSCKSLAPLWASRVGGTDSFAHATRGPHRHYRRRDLSETVVGNRI